MEGKQYDVVVLPSFVDDLKETADYITYHLRSPIAANRLMADVRKAIERRRSCAESFEACHSCRHRELPYYRIRVKNYSILYVVKGNIMEVRHIVHNRQDISSYI